MKQLKNVIHHWSRFVERVMAQGGQDLEMEGVEVGPSMVFQTFSINMEMKDSNKREDSRKTLIANKNAKLTMKQLVLQNTLRKAQANLLVTPPVRNFLLNFVDKVIMND